MKDLKDLTKEEILELLVGVVNKNAVEEIEYLNRGINVAKGLIDKLEKEIEDQTNSYAELLESFEVLKKKFDLLIRLPTTKDAKSIIKLVTDLDDVIENAEYDWKADALQDDLQAIIEIVEKFKKGLKK